MATHFPGAGEIARKWYVVDAEGETLGRLASRVARILNGKNNPSYTPFLDTGDHVIVVNAAKVRVTGQKSEKKIYYSYSGYPGGIKAESFRKRVGRRPEVVVRDAIVGMLPHTKLGRQMATKLRVYAGDQHPHQAQQPETVAKAKRA